MTEIKTILEEIASESSTNKKVEILQSYKDNKKLQSYLKMTLDPMINFNVTKKSFKDRFEIWINDNNINWFELKKYVLDKLCSREVTGHKALQLFIDHYVGNEIVLNIIFDMFQKKVWKANISIQLINRVWPDVIDKFQVQLAQKYSKAELPFDITYASRKLDGTRALIFIYENSIKIFSRNGKEIHTLESFKKDLLKHIQESHYSRIIPCVIDGELCVVDENNNESFQSIIKQLRRKDYDIKNATFYVFDWLLVDEFYENIKSPQFSYRLNALNYFCNTIDYDKVKALKQIVVKRESHLQRLIESASERNWEGIMLKNGESIYKGKRTKNLLKVKKMSDNEYTVTRLEEGSAKYIGRLGAAIIIHKDNEVHVGSGWSDSERDYYWKNKNELIGKKITVQYFEETKNQLGKYSLRFPVFKGVRDYE